MKPVKFFTTFSDNGYNVYGKAWIESFLARTAKYDNITAVVYVNNMDMSMLESTDKIKFVDFDQAIPHHSTWKKFYLENSTQDEWNKRLALKFSFKSFVMMDVLKHTDTGYAIWLDADCIFTSTKFKDFPKDVLEGKFIACQREAGSEHVESGALIFDTAHTDKDIFVNKFEEFYNTPEKFNDFSQFFDGFIIGRTLNHTGIEYLDLNEGYGLGGIQSDPNCTFLNPVLRTRFFHNIGITGKRTYENWEDYRLESEFQVIHGVNDPIPPTLEERLADVNANIMKMLQRR